MYYLSEILFILWTNNKRINLEYFLWIFIRSSLHSFLTGQFQYLYGIKDFLHTLTALITTTTKNITINNKI